MAEKSKKVLKYNGKIVPVINDNEVSVFGEYETYSRNAIDKMMNTETETKKESKVHLIKSSDNYQIRSEWDENNEISIRGSLHGSANNSFDMLYIDTFKTLHDDIAPHYIDYSYRGGNHGDDKGYLIDCGSAHGILESNIGQLWTDSNGVEYIILKIPSDTTILIGCPSANGLVATIPSSPLTHNGKSVAFNSSARKGVLSACNHISVKILDVDGNEIVNDGHYQGDYFDIVETYNIINILDMIEYLKDNVGNNTNESLYSDEITGKYCTCNNIHRFTERGAMTLFQSVDFERTTSINYIGGVQSMPIGSYYCVPSTNANLITLQGATDPAEIVSLTSDKWDNAEYPPNSYWQFDKANWTNGFVIGYCPEFGDGKAEKRKNISNAGQIYNTKKVYPYLVSNGQATNTRTVQCVSYRIPLNRYDEDIPAVGWYYVGKDIYSMIDVQKSVNKHLVLPNEFKGKKVTVVEKHGDITVSEFVGATGIRVITNEYGNVTLKLTE